MTGLFLLQKYVSWPAHKHIVKATEISTTARGRQAAPSHHVSAMPEGRDDRLWEISGTFVRVQPIQLLGEGLSRGVVLVLKLGRKDLVLYLGSEWLPAVEELHFAVGDLVTARALPARIDGQDMFLPAEVESAGQRLQLMDEEQLVMWRDLTQSLPQSTLWAQQLR